MTLTLTDYAPHTTIRAAIEGAHADGYTLAKHADPTEPARAGLTVGEAIEIALIDPSLVYLTHTDTPEQE